MKILIVDENSSSVRDLKRILERARKDVLEDVLEETSEEISLDILEAKEGFEAIIKGNQADIDIIFCDLRITGKRAFELIRFLRRSRGSIFQGKMLALSRDDNHGSKELSFLAGAHTLLLKPFIEPKVREVLRLDKKTLLSNFKNQIREERERRETIQAD